MRTETSTSPRRLEFFKTYWIGLSIYIPSNWVESRTHLVLFNFHHEPKNWSTYPGGFSPVLGIRINGRDNRFRLVNKYVQTDESVHQSSDVKTAFDVILPGSIQPGKWYDWVLEYHADWRNYSDGGRGITRVWRDGKMVVDYKGPNCVNGANMGYPKFGVYKSAWQDRNYDDWVVESVFYFDEFRISKADVGSYELVAPGASSGIIKPPRTPEPVNVS